MNHFMLWVFFAILVSTAFSVELTKDGLNILSKESLDFALQNKKTVFAIWNSPNCVSCGEKLWDAYMAIAAFLDENAFVVMAGTVGNDELVDKEYEIDELEGNTQYRLFIKGRKVPIAGDDTTETDLISWISYHSHLVPRRDCVTELLGTDYSSFMEKNRHRSVFIMYYIPAYAKSQHTIVQFQRAAYAFRIEGKVAFARLNCKRNADLCIEKEVKEMPSFKLYQLEQGKHIVNDFATERGEGMVVYLNEQLHTYVDAKTGYNERYGRVAELDRLARLFMANNNEGQKKRYLKETAQLRKRYHETGKYYKLMKKVLETGSPAIMTELREVREGMKDLSIEDPEYPKLRSRENIVHQFEAVTTEHTLVRLNPWNFDYVVNQQDNVIVLFHTSWCEMCKYLLHDLEEYVKTANEDVIFATMDATNYVDFCAQFKLHVFPALKYYKRNRDVKAPQDIAASDIDGLRKFLDNEFHNEKEL